MGLRFFFYSPSEGGPPRPHSAFLFTVVSVCGCNRPCRPIFRGSSTAVLRGFTPDTLWALRCAGLALAAISYVPRSALFGRFRYSSDAQYLPGNA
jgi:hypothetical protein